MTKPTRVASRIGTVEKETMASSASPTILTIVYLDSPAARAAAR